MTGIASIPTLQKTFIDTTLRRYLPKKKTLRTAFAEISVDSSQTSNNYARETQTYAEATGYQGITDTPSLLAPGTSPPASSMGTEDNTSYQKTHGLSFTMERQLLNSALPLQQQFIAEHEIQILNRIENDVNSTLYTNMYAAAGQTFTATAGTWSATGDAVKDINNAKNSFTKRAGGMEADKIFLHPDNLTDLQNDFRFQSTLYSQKGSIVDSGTLTPKPLGLDWINDTAVTKGTFLMCKTGMFGRLLISEPYKTYEKDIGTGDKQFSTVFSYIDQYHLPYLLMAGSGI